MDNNGKINPIYLNTLEQSSISLIKPSEIFYNTPAIFTINNYDSFINYTLSATNGGVTRSNETITFTANHGVNSASIVINDDVFTFSVTNGKVAQPVITFPVHDSIDQSLLPTFATSGFNFVGISQTQSRVHWEIATDALFTTVVQNYEGTSNYTSWMPNSLNFNTDYYVRVRYQGSVTGWSVWSQAVHFKTIVE